MSDKLQMIQMLRKMILIREFENTVSEYKDKKKIYGSTHCYNGEEAVAVGVCSALNTDDYIVSNHRPHGHALAKGMEPKIIMAEIFGKQTGSNCGKGGSMHIHDPSVGLITSSGIVGSGIPVGCGAAFAAKQENKGRIACVFFGDGSANEGILHESLNLASVWGLPILFFMEDNNLAITTNTRETSACNDYVKLASAYGIEGCHVDGQNVEIVFKDATEAIQFIRKNNAPYFMQAHTVRFNEHAEGNFYRRIIEKGYRDYEQLEKDKVDRCPIRFFASKLIKCQVLTGSDVENIIVEEKKKVAESVEFAVSSPIPSAQSAVRDVYREVMK